MSAKCAGCGREIVWAVTPDGKRIPLDPRPAVYRTEIVAGVQVCKRANGKDVPVAPTYLVGHHAVCPNVGDFNVKKRADRAAQEGPGPGHAHPL